MALIFEDKFDGDFFISYHTGNNIPRHDWSYHKHLVDELVIVLSGVSRILTEYDTYKFSGSFAIFYPAGQLHEQINDLNHHYNRYCINFKPSFIDDIIDPHKIPHSFCVFNLNEKELERFRTYLELIYSDDGDEHLLRTRRKYLLALIFNELEPIMLQRLSETDSRQVGCGKLVHDICFYINETCPEPLTLDDIAHHFYISRSKLVRLFRSELDMTVNDYITSARIARAKRLLRSGLTVHEAAEQSGFSSSGYFIKLFRRQTGETPARFKEHIINDEDY